MRVTSRFMGALAIVLFGTAASAAPFTSPLTPDQVACDELQLERLAGRLAIVEGLAGSGAVGLHPSLFLWRSSDGGSTYSALAVTDGIMGASGNLVRQETQLALDLVLHPPADTLNRMLPAPSCHREAS